MAKKIELTPLQERYANELRKLRNRLKSAFKAGFLNEKLWEKIPKRITPEFVKSKKPDTRDIEFLQRQTAKKIRTPKAAQLYKEAYQNEIEKSQPEQEISVGRKEIINNYLNDVYLRIDEEIYNPIERPRSKMREFNRVADLNQLAHILDEAIVHYGEDQINQFFADPDKVQMVNDIVEKITAAYTGSPTDPKNPGTEKDASVAIMRFASMLNGGPLTDEQMQTLEEAGAFDFYEDDLL